MAGNIIDGVLDAPRFSSDHAANFRVLEGFLAELCGQLRFTLENLSGDNFNDTEFVEYANRVLRTDSILTDSIYSDFGIIGNLTVSRLRTDYMRAERYRARNTGPLQYIDIRDNRLSFYHAICNAGTKDLMTDSGARLYYTDAMSAKMTTSPTAYPVTVYDYTETLLFSLEIGKDNGKGVEVTLRYGESGEIRFSDEGIGLSSGETALGITPDGIHGLEGENGVSLYVCDSGDFDKTLESAKTGSVILKKEDENVSA